MMPEATYVICQLFANNEPLIVVVEEDEWNALAHNEVNLRNRMLNDMLVALRLINENTPVGTYHFTLDTSRWFKLQFTLTPVSLN